MRTRDAQWKYAAVQPRSASSPCSRDPRKDAIADALSKHFGEQFVVEISVSAAEEETPHQKEERLSDERIDAARETLEADPNVKTLQTMFGAELRPESIELINPSQSD